LSRILALDIGNSRTKWGLHSGRGWISFGATPNADVGTLALREWQNLPRPAQVVGVNVAGERARMRVEAQLARWRTPAQWLAASAAAGGVLNRYEQPAQLGADRWAALVAARQRLLTAELFPQPAVVVNVGTAVTVDALDGEGVFRGGLILPGLQLMLRSLADHTAGLKVPPGSFQEFPTNTGDALYSGATQAIAGAIRMMRARLASPTAEVKCFLSGGAAGEIAPHIDGAVEVVEHLVLEGVLALADTD
jgi:type III pantothenate kinase